MSEVKVHLGVNTPRGLTTLCHLGKYNGKWELQYTLCRYPRMAGTMETVTCLKCKRKWPGYKGLLTKIGGRK